MPQPTSPHVTINTPTQRGAPTRTSMWLLGTANSR